MTIKKMMLLASAVVALVSFVAPAAAQANELYTDVGGSEVKAGSSTATGDQITLTGEVAMTAGPGFIFRSGPCQMGGPQCCGTKAGRRQVR